MWRESTVASKHLRFSGMKPTIRKATQHDVPAISQLLRANRADPSLFQQTHAQIRADVDSFYLAFIDAQLVGSAALVHHPGNTEILGVSVAPAHQGTGVGSALIRHLVDVARAQGLPMLWLGTAKPGYFERFGFQPMSRWRLPIRLLLHKLGLVLRQPAKRWLPAIFGRHVFMAWQTSAAVDA